ncbi:hypothetical protein B0H16DRAFT_1463976 [Mycena metata]|uniref:Uncharacterized protein n=1 Tax=Mycena metata TaxID=1033252 RepID=A0AAD7N2K7_9AGAR|nr:hypothetical protein B0H16DRAFT_1463976 [Mycena metata]
MSTIPNSTPIHPSCVEFIQRCAALSSVPVIILQRIGLEVVRRSQHQLYLIKPPSPRRTKSARAHTSIQGLLHVFARRNQSFNLPQTLGSNSPPGRDMAGGMDLGRGRDDEERRGGDGTGGGGDAEPRIDESARTPSYRPRCAGGCDGEQGSGGVGEGGDGRQGRKGRGGVDEGGDEGERGDPTCTHMTQLRHPSASLVGPALDSRVCALVRCVCGAIVYARAGNDEGRVREGRMGRVRETRENMGSRGAHTTQLHYRSASSVLPALDSTVWVLLETCGRGTTVYARAGNGKGMEGERVRVETREGMGRWGRSRGAGTGSSRVCAMGGGVRMYRGGRDGRGTRRRGTRGREGRASGVEVECE